MFDTNAAAVEVLRGGSAGPLRRVSTGLFGVDIVFTAPLAAGETSSLEYRTVFSYRDAPPPEFRRAAVTRPVSNVVVRVQFHPERLPAAVEWAQWDDFAPEAEPVATEAVDLDAEAAVHRYVARLERAAVGFRWTW